MEHKFQRNLVSFFAFFSTMNNTSPKSLYQYEGVQGNADAMMRVGQGSRRPNGLEAEHKDNGS
jgi:hypothetical protein